MNQLNLTEVIQNARFNRFHLKLALLGFLLIVFDGYDVAVFGTITPPLMAEWGIDAVTTGTISSMGLVGMMVGAFGFGALADRLGRRRVIMITVVLYSLFTALCGFAHEPVTFTIFRFIAGLGLGGIMPNVIALLTDFLPKRVVATVTTAVLCGFAVGGLLSPLLGLVVIPAYGWQVSMWIAGIMLPLLPLVWRIVPESVTVLRRKGRQDDLVALVKRIDPGVRVDASTEFTAVNRAEIRKPVTDLFKGSRARATFLFWTVLFFHLLLAYGILTWLPKLMMDTGISFSSSLTFSIAFQVGGVVGTLIGGRMADRVGAKRIIVPMYLLGTLVVAVLGFNQVAIITYVLIFVAGGTITGVQNIVQVYIAQYYPPFIRATALGSALSIGRLGGILGPIIGGVLLAASLSNQTIFLLFALPALIATVAVLAVNDRFSFQRQIEATGYAKTQTELVALELEDERKGARP